MSQLDIIRAWKDEEFRNSLSAEQIAQMPVHPVGAIELTDADVYAAAGLDSHAAPVTTAWFCTLSAYVYRCCH